MAGRGAMGTTGAGSAGVYGAAAASTTEPKSTTHTHGLAPQQATPNPPVRQRASLSSARCVGELIHSVIAPAAVVAPHAMISPVHAMVVGYPASVARCTGVRPSRETCGGFGTP